MQSATNETFQTDSLNSSTQDTDQSSQHGLPDSDYQPSRQLPAEEGRVQCRPSASHTLLSDTSSEGSGGCGRGSDRSLGRLSASCFHTGSPKDRISEHEKALTRSSKKNRGGPTFTVVAKIKKPTHSGPAIANFPNGKAPTPNSLLVSNAHL